jgi:N-methylhydantoinase B
MREGSVVGKAKHPFSSSVATTNINDRAVTAVMCAFNQITDRMGMAEPHFDQGVGLSVISGNDSRFGNRPYVTQLIMGYSGGMGVNGHDGYLHQSCSAGGMWISNPVEMTESAYPVLFVQQEIMPDAIGSGTWDGAPAVRTVIKPTTDAVTFVYVADGHFNPARGAAGGLSGVPAQAMLHKVIDGIDTEFLEDLPTFPDPVRVNPGEAICGIYSSAGGYGDPLERDPQRVRHRVIEGWISAQKARGTYGVVLVKSDTPAEVYRIDWDATQALRANLRKERKGGGQ